MTVLKKNAIIIPLFLQNFMDKDFMQVDKDFIEKLYNIIGETPENFETLSPEDLSKLAEKIKNKIDDTRKNQTTSAEDVTNALQAFSSNELQKATSVLSNNDDIPANFIQDDDSVLNSILIIDDLGVITYQLNLTFQKLGFNTSVSQEIFDALEKFKNAKFNWVVMDLFIPTEREGFMLLSELRKIISLNNLSTKIVIISATNKKDHKMICLQKGADLFIEKTTGWQDVLISQCMS